MADDCTAQRQSSAGGRVRKHANARDPPTRPRFQNKNKHQIHEIKQ